MDASIGSPQRSSGFDGEIRRDGKKNSFPPHQKG
ncbi:hypothetical protein JOF46_004048 [Paeniglutamicibacter psychrophenolicus]|uniref:Uncharacterized protein n=1 Tax=Paeniglutamicibacter psychrophenolicus TaxID=257454 RepID=A0ABS4WJC8_9MICC|nr:hypothetical protein [Paeniglutamicibacter psychrophenolicus]